MAELKILGLTVTFKNIRYKIEYQGRYRKKKAKEIARR